MNKLLYRKNTQIHMICVSGAIYLVTFQSLNQFKNDKFPLNDND